MTLQGRPPLLRRFGAVSATLIVIVLLGGFCAAALVRYSPGFASIPEDLDPSISPETLRVLHQRHEARNPLPVFYAHYIAAALRGDFGVSSVFNRPVSSLLLRRAPVTARLVALGAAAAWMIAGFLVWISVRWRNALMDAAISSTTGLLLAVPPAVLALAFFFKQGPLPLALALALLPRITGTLHVLVGEFHASPVVLAARARAVNPLTIAMRYVVASAAPQLVALAGVSLVLAFGTAIPIEALCDVPGLGALALQAALGRDMPLLCALALLITFFVTLVHGIGEMAVEGAR